MDPLSLDQLKEELNKIFPDDEAKKTQVDDAHLAKIASMVNTSEDDSVLASLTELIGDLARVDENRERLGATDGLLERLVAILARTQNVTLQKWTARALGNLTYEHEESIDKIIAAGVVPRLIELMASEDVDVKRNSTGALANVSSVDHAKELVVQKGVIPVVFNLLHSDNEAILMMAYRVVTNIGDNENNRVELVKAGGFKLLIDFLRKNRDENTTVEALSALGAMIENNLHALEFVKEGGLKVLVPLLADDEAETAQVTAADVLHNLASIDELKSWFLAEGVIPQLLNLAKAPEATTRKHSIKIVAQLVLNDEVANSLFQEVELLLSLLQLSDDPEIQLNAAMIVGNIARSDDKCVRLVDAGAARALSPLLSTRDARLQHLAAGALRNLSISTQNKIRVADTVGVVPGLIACLSSTNAHAMFAAIGAIKALLAAPENRRKFVVDHDNGLEALIRIKDAIIIDTTEKSEDKPKDLRIQFEAARTLAILAEEPAAHERILREAGVGLLHFLLDSPFEILQHEGLRAVRHLVTAAQGMDDAVLTKLVLDDGFIDVLLNGLTKTKSDEVIVGIVGLLSSLADTDKFRERMVERNADGVLSGLTSSPAQTEASQTLRTKLTPPQP